MSSISLSMIVKNEEKHLARCLSSVKEVADEIVVVDTGSSDTTIEIAKSFGAKIFHFDWINDFSAARNFSLSKCTGNWILYLDADEELSKYSVEELNKIKIQSAAGVNCKVISPGTKTSSGSVFRYPRLFANVSGVKFSGKVHEQILDSLMALKLPIVDSNIEIIHHGYSVDEETLKIKKERNLSLLLSIDDKTASDYDKLKLIHTFISLKKFDEAENRLNEFLKSRKLFGGYTGIAYLHFANLRFEQNNLIDALNFSMKAKKLLKNNSELDYLLYLIYIRTKKFHEAYKYLLSAIKENQLLITDSKPFKDESILDHTELYLRAINLGYILQDKTKIEKDIKNFYDFLSSQNKIRYKNLLSEIIDLFLHFKVTEKLFENFEAIFRETHLALLIEIISNSGNDLLIKSVIQKLLFQYPYSAVLYKKLGLLNLESDILKSIELFNKSLQYENDPTVLIHLISAYLSLGEINKVKETLLKLDKEYSTDALLSQQIELLKQKLKPILKN